MIVTPSSGTIGDFANLTISPWTDVDFDPDGLYIVFDKRVYYLNFQTVMFIRENDEKIIEVLTTMRNNIRSLSILEQEEIWMQWEDKNGVKWEFDGDIASPKS